MCSEKDIFYEKLSNIGKEKFKNRRMNINECGSFIYCEPENDAFLHYYFVKCEYNFHDDEHLIRLNPTKLYLQRNFF